MMLASLFLVWGREAYQLTQLFTEPVYFVSGLSFPVGRLGMLGALAIATIPLAVGLDAMRQLAFVGGDIAFGTPSPEIEALILVAMTVVFLARGPMDAAARWSGWRAAKAACRSDGSDERRTSSTRAASAPRPGAASTRRGRDGSGRARCGAASGRPPSSAGRWRPTGPIRSLFFIYSVAKPVSAALILVVILDIVSGGNATRRTAGSWSSGRRSGRSSWPASPASPGRSSTTASATGCSSTSTSARATSWWCCSGRGVARIGVGGDGRGHHHRRRRRAARRPVRALPRSPGRCSSS